MSQWHTIDSAPGARREPVLLWNGIEVREGFWYAGSWVALGFYMGVYRYPPATHWMEMPKPPRPGEG